MALNATFNNISAISWWLFYWWKKPEYQEKTTDMPQVTDKLLSYSVVSNLPRLSEFELTTLVVVWH
jgi:hypothetical protein